MMVRQKQKGRAEGVRSGIRTTFARGETIERGVTREIDVRIPDMTLSAPRAIPKGLAVPIALELEADSPRGAVGYSNVVFGIERIPLKAPLRHRMRTFFRLLLGGFQILFALAMVAFAIAWVVKATPLLLGANFAIAAITAFVATTAATTNAYNGLRLVRSRSSAPPMRGKLLPRVSYGSALVMLGLIGADIYHTENRPMHSDVAVAAIGKPFDLSFTAYRGGAVDVSAMKGKVILIDFWATWCGPCKAELPQIVALHQKWHAAGFEVIGISLDQDTAALDSYLDAHPLPWPNYFDGKVWQNPYVLKYQVHMIPQLWLIDKTGRLRDLNGYIDLEQKVKKLLRE
jgi:thiol-disulfide isomerase/thioredoxin